MSDILLEARGLTRDFPAGRKKKLHAVSDVSLQIREGETLGIVGESGCGKSTLGRMLIRLLAPTSGSVLLRGEDITALSDRDFRKYRRELQMIFQDPYASLDPRMTVRDIIAEPLRTWGLCPDKDAVTERVLELMKAVEIPAEFLTRYPHQFSGGQRQRIDIARALAAEPSLIVCDEPVSALDVSVQNQILNLLNDIRKKSGITYLFISHELSVIRYVSDRVCVIFLGKICEIGPTEEIYTHPGHPYTRFLLDSLPVPDPRRRDREVQLLAGDIPSPVDPPSGCRFRTRCPRATSACGEREPEPVTLGDRTVACIHPLIS